MDGLTDRWTKNHEIIIGGHIEAVLNSIEVEKIWSYKSYKLEILVQTQEYVSEEVGKTGHFNFIIFTNRLLKIILVAREND